MRSDISHLLARVDIEKHQSTHEVAIKELQDMITQSAIPHRSTFFKLEDFKNRNRWNNLWTRGLPEATKDGNLEVTSILNTILGKSVSNPLRFDHVHHALQPRNVSAEQPTDVICHLHYVEEKNATIWLPPKVATLHTLISRRSPSLFTWDQRAFDGASWMAGSYPKVLREHGSPVGKNLLKEKCMATPG